MTAAWKTEEYECMVRIVARHVRDRAGSGIKWKLIARYMAARGISPEPRSDTECFLAYDHYCQNYAGHGLSKPPLGMKDRIFSIIHGDFVAHRYMKGLNLDEIALSTRFYDGTLTRIMIWRWWSLVLYRTDRMALDRKRTKERIMAAIAGIFPDNADGSEAPTKSSSDPGSGTVPSNHGSSQADIRPPHTRCRRSSI